MGLNGRLEDLPLLDIVQVVAFSQKTGYLSVETGKGDAAIVFERGLVVCAFVPDAPPLAVAGLSPDQRAQAIRGRIENALEHLVRLREGAFLFSLTPEVPKTIEGRELGEETLEYGIKAEELLLELARGMDEDRRDATAAVESGFAESATEAVEAAPEPAAAAEPEPEPVSEERLEPLPEEPGPAEPMEFPALDAASSEPEGGHRVVLLVDDEPDLRSLLAQVLIEGDWQVVEAGTPASALRAARSLQDLGLPFVLMVDRGMPASDGSSFDGGLEVVKRLKKAGFEVPVLLMTDRLTKAAQERARRLGIARFVFKPTLSRLDPDQFAADIRAFAVRIREGILPTLDAAALPPAPLSPAVATHLPRTEEAWREAAELQRRLEALRRPQDAMQISTLVMNMARDFFERSALFIVKDEELRGLGGFGPTTGDPIIFALRDIAIPLAEPSIFQDVVGSGRPFYGAPPAGRCERRLLEALGRFRASDCALLPLVTNRETIALLFGDNPDTGTEVRPAQTLEVFLSQAGMALETAFLQRKLDSRQGRHPDGSEVSALRGSRG
jgi:CheY-like chemotaxis protein